VSIVHVSRRELATRRIAEAITTRGKELSVLDTVADARRLFANRSVQVIPVLDGATYVGAIDRGSFRDDAADDAPLAWFASELLVTTTTETPAAQALAALDRTGSTRLVVLDADRLTYAGLVCLRSDRDRLCVDAECRAEAANRLLERTFA
jgi:CBS domain-containing protein